MDELRREWPAGFQQGLAELNAGEYFTCHETLEELWKAERGEVRLVYQGVLQIAVGCYHLTVRQNWVGAVNKLDAGARKLEAWPRCMAGVDLAGLISQADRLREHLTELGRERVGDYDPRLLPRVSVCA